jgi:hypothetical protein
VLHTAVSCEAKFYVIKKLADGSELIQPTEAYKVVQLLITSMKKYAAGRHAVLSEAWYVAPLEILMLVEGYDAVLDIRNNEGSTALMCAACKGKDIIVRLLLKEGASLDTRNNFRHDSLAVITRKIVLLPWKKRALLAALKR